MNWLRKMWWTLSPVPRTASGAPMEVVLEHCGNAGVYSNTEAALAIAYHGLSFVRASRYADRLDQKDRVQIVLPMVDNANAMKARFESAGVLVSVLARGSNNSPWPGG